MGRGDSEGQERERKGMGNRTQGHRARNCVHKNQAMGALDYKVVFVWGGGSSAAKQPDWLPSIV